MIKRCYYETLECQKSATVETLKGAYRKLAMQFHPDRNPGDASAEVKFKSLSEAYDVLKDDQKRAAYDRFGHAAFENGGGGRQGARDFRLGAGFADIFDEMFGAFGGQRRGGGNNRGNDLRFNLEVTLEEAFKGKQTTVKVTTLAPCEPCGGSGAAAGAQTTTCPTCRRARQVRAQQALFMVQITCPTCHGAGRVIDNPCRGCSGQGRVRKEKS